MVLGAQIQVLNATNLYKKRKIFRRYFVFDIYLYSHQLVFSDAIISGRCVSTSFHMQLWVIRKFEASDKTYYSYINVGNASLFLHLCSFFRFINE
ncbi:hypothetical protein Barb6_01233 [Bacteroidales bacterium Barb6]|nr:hypothetical protein Barb6_01233 [Bacteroidales bacterium Barb6]